MNVTNGIVERGTLLTLLGGLILLGSMHLAGQEPPKTGILGQRQAIISDVGWHEAPDTQLAPHCPSEDSIRGVGGCRSVIDAWNSAVLDTKRNRLIIWGGGHTDYFGNEVYALDLTTASMSRLTDPSPVSNVNDCPESYVDGAPSARHTYDSLVYDPGQDAMFAFGGSRANCGSMSTAIWKLQLSTLKWVSMEPHKGEAIYNAPGIAADYDPSTRAIYVADRQNFLRYDPQTNTLSRLASLPNMDYHLAGVIDSVRNLFILVGGPGQFWAIQIGPHVKSVVHDWSKRSTACDKLLHAPFPGLAFDPVQKLLVGWVGGDSVILFNPDTMSCTEQSYPGGPGAAQKDGTNGRFRYVPVLEAFVIVNDWKENAFFLRLGSPIRKSP